MCNRVAHAHMLHRSIYILTLGFVSLLAGSDGGSLSGTVSDQTGAQVPGVRIALKAVDTGVERTTVTGDDGAYAFPALAVGVYQIDIEQRGFKPYRKTGLRIDADSSLRVDATLELGERSDAVAVTESAVQVDTAETQMGGTIPGRTVGATPLIGRSFTDLLPLQPGVVPLSSQ